ncbi:MAG TPA: CocE/NonD family hydrolase, partial [Isosphaeraceae bacterium]|nr:CocE/NonD family hydrolase [Isosphaeraceae bacterium]
VEVIMRMLLPGRVVVSGVLMTVALGLLSPGSASAQGQEYVKATYTKYEYRIPMRDGKRLFTSVYVPKHTTQRYPIMMTRTPYSVQPYGIDKYKSDLGPSPLFGKEGYIFVYQDVRGRWMSEGDFVNMRPHRDVKEGSKEIDESTDTWDSIDWLIKNVPGHNGRVGMSGISYPGFYTAAGMIDAHPALKAASPQAPVTDWFMGDDWHHNGALFLPHIFNFMASFGHPRPEPTAKFAFNFDHGTPDGYQFFMKLGPLTNVNERYYKNDVAFWNEVVRHGSYDDFWQARNLRPHLKKIRPAVMTVGGWFDAENLFGALETYKNVEASSPGTFNTLVMGPWLHGGWSRGNGDSLGNVKFNSQTAAFYREEIELPFFNYHLKDKGELRHPEAWVFETGKNEWQKHATWPPQDARPKTLYLRASGRLSFEPPNDSGTATSFDEYTSDPARPVPFIDKTAIGMTGDYMVGDQRFAARRPDVLVYETEPLENDVTVVGPLLARLVVSTTGTDSDWVVKLIDVYPDDYPDPEPNPTGVRMGAFQQLVRGDVMRGKFRESFESPAPFDPGQPTQVSLPMQDTYHTFRTGHRIMVQVQSSWFPLVDRNPQKFVDIYNASESDFQKATQRVYRSPDRASRLEVRVRP